MSKFRYQLAHFKWVGSNSLTSINFDDHVCGAERIPTGEAEAMAVIDQAEASLFPQQTR